MYRFILLEADGEMSPWSKLCISQADCVLLVAAPDASPQVRLVAFRLVECGRVPYRITCGRTCGCGGAVLRKHRDDVLHYDARFPII